ncbi:MAG: dihydrolipoyl dehydrogenase, partial [Candidatus Margulisbacteria bacterium]|nr:dihydrolipoyl dehydrogenase [Candidatus Margulisiibacteriota bacterium]
KEKQQIKGNKVMIATGSESMPLPSVPVDGKKILFSEHALSLRTVPKRLIVIGGGGIGVEIGSVFGRLGSKVTIIEFMDRLIPTMDKQLGKSLQKSLGKMEFTFHLSTKVTGAAVKKNSVVVSAETVDGKSVSVEGDIVLVSIGRRPYTDALGLDTIGLNTDERGRVAINETFQTSIPHIYAIGDVIKGAMLAHKASEEAVVCVETMMGEKPHINYDAIPNVVYTWPEVASVGKTEEMLKEQGIVYKTGSFPFKASGRARAAEESDGFIKVLADAESDEVLGIHMIGPRAADMISAAMVAYEYRASAEDLGMMPFAHPTFMENLKEAALMATNNRAIHI